MAQSVNLAGTMPGESVNGLFAIAEALIKDGRRLRLVVGLIDTDTIKTKVATSDQVPVVQFRHIEVADGTGHAEAVAEILHALLTERTGQAELMLPFTPGSFAPPPQPKAGRAGEED